MTSLEAYDRVKRTQADSVILVRNDDFYHTFRDDAKTVADVCSMSVVTECGPDGVLPMFGFPVQHLNRLLMLLVQSGKSVRIVNRQPETKGAEA